jgi:hypothetical protein
MLQAAQHSAATATPRNHLHDTWLLAACKLTSASSMSAPPTATCLLPHHCRDMLLDTQLHAAGKLCSASSPSPPTNCSHIEPAYCHVMFQTDCWAPGHLLHANCAVPVAPFPQPLQPPQTSNSHNNCRVACRMLHANCMMPSYMPSRQPLKLQSCSHLPSVSADTHPAQPCMSSEFQELTLPVEKTTPGLVWCSTSTCGMDPSTSANTNVVPEGQAPGLA